MGETPGLMYPSDMAGVAAAKAVCAGCVVREECLEYALANDEQFGIWGGESEYARRKLRRARKAGTRRPAATRPPARRDSRGPAKGRPPPRGDDGPPRCGV